MLKTVFAAAALSLALAPVAAQADPTRNFSHEGVDYAFKAEQKGDVTVIEGNASGQVPFRLYVKGNRITGTYNNRNISFTKTDVAKNSPLSGK